MGQHFPSGDQIADPPVTESALIDNIRAWTSRRIFASPLKTILAAIDIREQASLAGYRRAEAYSYLLQAMAELHQGKHVLAGTLLDRAAALLTSDDDPWALINLSLHRKKVEVRLGLRVIGQEEFLEDLVAAERLGDAELTWQIHNALSNLAEMQDRYGDAIDWASRGFDLAQENDLWFERQVARMRLAAFHRRLGITDTPIEMLQQIVRECTDDGEDDHLLVFVWQSIADAVEARGQLAVSLDCQKTILRLARRLEDWSAIGFASFKAAVLYAEAGDVACALARLDEAEDAWQRAGGPTYRGFDVVARWYREDLTASWSWETVAALQEIAEARKTIHRDVMGFVLRALADSFQKLGDYLGSMDYRLEELAVREAYWREAANHVAHLAAKAHDTKLAMHRAEEEEERRKALGHALEEVVRLNDRNEHLIDQLRARSALLETLAWQDGLTGVGNRRLFDLRLTDELVQFATPQRLTTVCLLDIDDFKRINDRHSHTVGDEVLKTVARILQANTRESDLVARYGGEEFAFCLTERGREDAVEVAERIRSAIESHPWREIAIGLKVTVSIGVCSTEGEDDPVAVLAHADTLLYQAKALGKNCIREGYRGTIDLGSSRTARMIHSYWPQS